MCGFLGLLGKEVKENKSKAVICLQRLNHRGPDAQEIYLSEKFKLILGHARLKILDLTNASAQPFFNEEKTHCIVFNGEIYNYLELKDELEKKGVSFHTTSDTEVFLKAFIFWGSECLQKLDGMWSAGIFNFQNQELFLARDRFGEKPLFYSLMDDAIAFGSEIKAVAPFSKKIRFRENLKATDWLTYESSEETLIKEVQRLPAGFYAIYKNQSLIKTRYWYTEKNLPTIPKLYEEQVREFYTLVAKSCKLRLRSDVRISAALSGGIDSGSICAHLAQILNSPKSLETFSAIYPNGKWDESGKSSATSHFLKVKNNQVEICALESLHQLEKSMYYFEEIYLTPPSPFFLFYQKMRERGFFVSLDGHGADEILGGYAFDVPDAVRDAESLKSKFEILKTYERMNPLANPSTLRKNLFRIKKILSKKQQKNFTVPSEIHGFFNATLWERVHRNLLPTLLRNYDRFSMGSGVEIRMPFLDHKIVTYGLALPWSSKIRDGLSKKILRDSVGHLLPAEVVSNPVKIGFNVPLNQWFLGPWRDWLFDTIHGLEFQQSELIPSLKPSWLQKLISGDNISDAQAQEVWLSVAPFLWEKMFFKKLPILENETP